MSINKQPLQFLPSFFHCSSYGTEEYNLKPIDTHKLFYNFFVKSDSL